MVIVEEVIKITEIISFIAKTAFQVKNRKTII